MDTRRLLLTCLLNVYHSLLFKNKQLQKLQILSRLLWGSAGSWEHIEIVLSAINIVAGLLIDKILYGSDHLWRFILDKVR